MSIHSPSAFLIFISVPVLLLEPVFISKRYKGNTVHRSAAILKFAPDAPQHTVAKQWKNKETAGPT